MYAAQPRALKNLYAVTSLIKMAHFADLASFFRKPKHGDAKTYAEAEIGGLVIVQAWSHACIQGAEQ